MFVVESMLLVMVILLFFIMVLWSTTMNLSDYMFLRSKSSTFECGFEMKDQCRQPFSLRFFLIIIVFLIFDIELCMLLNLPLMKHFWFFNHRWLMLFIFFILILGMLEEWRRGLLKWK